MQKLSGTSSDKNNNSCGIFHHESKNVSFSFFWCFYDFLRNLQETAKALLLFELPIAGRPSKRTFVLQCGPWPSGSGGPAAIPAGGGWGSVLWANRGQFGAWLVKKGLPAGVLRGSRWWPPLERLLRRDGRLGGGGACERAASYGRGRGEWRKVALARGRPDWSSPRLLDLAPADGTAAGWSSAPQGGKQRLLLRRPACLPVTAGPSTSPLGTRARPW
jgi:hypothetical protein